MNIYQGENQKMAIKSSTFGRVELSGNEAARFVRHMNEDKPNTVAAASLARGRDLVRQISQGAKFSLSLPKSK